MPPADTLTDDDAVAAVERWQADPVAFAREALGVTTLWWRQIEILESVRDNRTTHVPAGNGIGKDFTASVLVPWWMTDEDSIVVTTATTARQVEVILWNEIRTRIRKAVIPLGGVLAPAAASWKFPPNDKWFAIGLTASDPNGFAGFHGKRVLLIRDEAAGISPANWEASRACASGANDRILNIGNPICGPDHPFDVESSMPALPGKRKTIRVSTMETPNYVEGREVLPGVYGREFVDEMREIHGEDSVVFRARVGGIFPGGAADGLISLAEIALARQRDAAGVKSDDADVVRLGCDPAREGDDLTVIYAVRGCRAWEVARIAKGDGPTISAALVKAANDFRARSIAIDSTGGWGSAPIDYTRQAIARGEVAHDCALHEVNFGSKPSDPVKWKDRRTELWWRMRDWLKDRASFDPDRVIENELLAPKVFMWGTGHVLESKEDFKKRIRSQSRDNVGKSPDRADALALAISGHLGSPASVLTETTTAPRIEDRRRRLAGWSPRSGPSRVGSEDL